MSFTTLVSPIQIMGHLEDPSWVVLDCRFTLTNPESGRAAYLRGHIPGARYVHLEEDLSGPVTPTSGRHPLPDPRRLAEKLGACGVDGTKQVVAYDDSFGSIAGRLWWLLRWLGHDAVALLDGGLQRWQREGLPMTAEHPYVPPAVLTPRPNNALWVDERQVMERLRRPAIGGLVDARSPERFHGEREPLDPVAGHIPGAVNHPYEDNLDFSGNFLPPEELRKIYRKVLNGTPPEENIQMCGSGVTACHNLLAMEIAGLSGSRLYPGSWSAWITDPSRPIVTLPSPIKGEGEIR